MSLTQCPDCHHLSFVDAATCPNCSQVFAPGVLHAIAVAEERGFRRKYRALFLTLLLVVLGVLLLVVLQDYANSRGLFDA